MKPDEDIAQSPSPGVTSRIPWVRVLVEGLVIVGSILLAFGIEAWWDGRQERERELDALERLDVELSEVDDVLAQWQEAHLGVLEATRVLLEHTGPDGPRGLASDSIAALLATMTWAWTVDPPTATLASLETSGRLGALRNQRLLTALASWRALLADLQADEQDVKAVVDRDIVPFLNSRIAFKTVSAFDRGLLAEEPGPPSRFPDGFARVLATREFENLLDQRRSGTANIVNNYDIIRASLAELRALVQQALRR